MRGDPRARVPIDGRCFAYVFPCLWEDHCKIGFSHDPLARIAALHPRWYAFFDLENGWLVEAESERDVRDLELELRRPFAAHNAPAPLTIRAQAGGGTEWFRGVAEPLALSVRALAQRGYRVHPLQGWLQAALSARREGLHEWTLAQLPADGMDGRHGDTSTLRRLRDQLDAFAALDVPLDDVLPDAVMAWYRRAGGQA